MSRKEEDKKRHEYMLMEIRLTGEDIKASIHERYDKRIASLEHWRTRVNGILAGLGLAWATFEAWFRYGSKLKS
jgi:hypothetical protein